MSSAPSSAVAAIISSVTGGASSLREQAARVSAAVQTVTTKKVESESFATKEATIDFDQSLVFDALNVKSCTAAAMSTQHASRSFGRR